MKAMFRDESDGSVLVVDVSKVYFLIEDSFPGTDRATDLTPGYLVLGLPDGDEWISAHIVHYFEYKPYADLFLNQDCVNFTEGSGIEFKLFDESEEDEDTNEV